MQIRDAAESSREMVEAARDRHLPALRIDYGQRRLSRADLADARERNRQLASERAEGGASARRRSEDELVIVSARKDACALELRLADARKRGELRQPLV